MVSDVDSIRIRTEIEIDSTNYLHWAIIAQKFKLIGCLINKVTSLNFSSPFYPVSGLIPQVPHLDSQLITILALHPTTIARERIFFPLIAFNRTYVIESCDTGSLFDIDACRFYIRCFSSLNLSTHATPKL